MVGNRLLGLVMIIGGVFTAWYSINNYPNLVTVPVMGIVVLMFGVFVAASLLYYGFRWTLIGIWGLK